MVGGIRYFPSLHGRIQPIDMRADEVKVLPDWSLISAADDAEHPPTPWLAPARASLWAPVRA